MVVVAIVKIVSDKQQLVIKTSLFTNIIFNNSTFVISFIIKYIEYCSTSKNTQFSPPISLKLNFLIKFLVF